MSLVPQVGFFELLVIAIIALVVVGPRDLPKLMRTAGKYAGKARRMAAEFSNAFQQMAREAEMEDMRREIEALKKSSGIDEAKRALQDAADPVNAALREGTQSMSEAQAAAERPAP